ncbi:CD1108 family mobile element protein [Kineothrix sedimenti]|uniref:Peptidoglycan DD-metalloendopeptidase family protein n=1 Tax=Kineothrix sedimenti TaxID=3123317 RepID=A0ABZ3ERL2_9FIRM
MPDYEINAQDKIVQKMSRDGLVQENLVTGEQENVSSKKADFEYNALKGAEKAINVTADFHDFRKQYSSSGSEEPEEDTSESDSTYKSSYEQERTETHQKTKDGKKTESEDQNTNERKFNRQKGKSSSQSEENVNDKDSNYKFIRDVKQIGVTEEEPFKNKYAKKLEKYDKKIFKADAKVEKRKKKLPGQYRLKFEKVYSINEKDEIKIEGRLKFSKERYSKKQYNSIKTNKRFKRQALHETTKSAGWRSWSQIRRDNRDEVHESELDNVKSAWHKGKRQLKKSQKIIEKYRNPYAKLDRANSKASYYRLRRDEIEYKGLPKEQKQLQKQLQKKKYKKAAIQKSMEQGGQRVLRHRNLFTRAKDAIVRLVKAVKTFFTLASSLLTIIIIIFSLIIGIFILAFLAIGMGGEAIIKSTYQAGYDQISDCTAYMKKLETDLEERISKIETEEYPDCYEYIYNLGDINHNPIELISYLAAKYVEFDLEKCQEEIDSIFEEMYTLTIEIKEEPRERAMRDEYGEIIYDSEGNPVMETFMARICYITLEVKPLEDIINERLDTDQKESFDTYMLSSGGQQVYANCLPDDWGSLISSKFGERIHPVTGERSFHTGIDIAVPEGTSLYSSCAGTVTTSAYSDTAGNYIIVTMDNGWSIKYMHLSSREVTAGDTVLRGQFLGETGNTGRSTGAHLHLEVRDANDNPIDPTFMIPSSSVVIENK